MIRRFLRWLGWFEPLPHDFEDAIRNIEPIDTPFMRRLYELQHQKDTNK